MRLLPEGLAPSGLLRQSASLRNCRKADHGARFDELFDHALHQEAKIAQLLAP